jgi:flagellar hook-basal body complex protein FliE
VSGFDGIPGIGSGGDEIPRPSLIGERVLGPELQPERGPTPFEGALADALAGLRGLQQDTQDKAAALASGEPVHLHDLMIAMNKTELAFNLMLEVRNKLVDAWQQVTRMVV